MKLKCVYMFLMLCLIYPDADAETLLRCSPPMGSSLQEVVVSTDGQSIYATELNFSGSISKPFLVPFEQWEKRELVWNHQSEGLIQLKQIRRNNRFYWQYTSSSPYSRVTGPCTVSR